MKMIMKLVGSLSLTIWLSMVLIVLVEAQITDDTIYDTDGEALQAGVEYYIVPAKTQIGGRPVTLILRNNTSPYYVGQAIFGKPVVFTPFEEGETVIREFRDLKIEFPGGGSSSSQSSYAWLLDYIEPITGRTLITTGIDTNPRWPIRNYFRIQGTKNEYSFRWCPTEVCSPLICRYICEDVGRLYEDGKTLLALDGTCELPFKFQRAHINSII